MFYEITRALGKRSIHFFVPFYESEKDFASHLSPALSLIFKTAHKASSLVVADVLKKPFFDLEI